MGLIDNVNVNVGGNGNVIDTLSTYVTKVLKPNIINGKNILSQDMMPIDTGANTKYVIKYDFELNEDITVPANCVLEFDGGSLANAQGSSFSITGQSTGIIATITTIFDSNVIFFGSWNVKNIYSAWFTVSDNTIARCISLCDDDVINNVYIEGNYNISASIFLKSNTKVIISGTLKRTITSLNSDTINIYGKKNITIVGGNIDGDKDSFDSSSAYSNFVISNSKNIIISDINIYNASHDGINIMSGGNNENINILNCIIHDCKRQGISVTQINNLKVEHCEFYNIYGAAPGLAIDIEPNTNSYCTNITINKIYVHNCVGGVGCNRESDSGGNKNIVISNSTFVASSITNSGLFENSYTDKVIIYNCTFTDTESSANQLFSISINTNDELIFDNCTIYAPSKRIANTSAHVNCLFVNCKITCGTFTNVPFEVNVDSCNIICTKLFDSGTSLGASNCYITNSYIEATQTITFRKNSNCKFKNNYVKLTLSSGHAISINIDCDYLEHTNNTYRILGTPTEAIVQLVAGKNSKVNNNSFICDSILYKHEEDGGNGECLHNIFYNSDGTIITNKGDRGRYSKTWDFGYAASTTRYNGRYIGERCFDTTLGKPIYWDGTQWVDATGTPV